MATHRLKHSFSAGELSPLMEARTDFSRYQNGCLKLKNMIVNTQGPVSRRSGTEFVYDLSTLDLNDDPQLRFIPFIFNEIQSYVLIFYQSTEVLGIDTYYYKMVIGYNKALLTYESQTPFNTQPYTTTQSTYLITGTPGSGNPRTYIITYDSDGSEHEIPPGNVSEGAPIGNEYIATITGTWEDGVLTVYSGYHQPDTDPVSLTMEPGWHNGFDYAQSADVMYFAMDSSHPLVINRYSHTEWATELAPLDAPHPDWTIVGVENNWPKTVSFHQQRLAFGGNLTRRQTIWMSEAGNFNNFTVDADQDSDPISFTLDSGTQNLIQWLVSSKALNVGTLGNEWTVVGANRDALVPGGTVSHRQTNMGSEKVEPLLIGMTIVFLERFGRTINEFVYDFNTDSYKSSDMSILSKHVTDFFSITDWSYQQTPDSIIWAIREDGAMLGVTYQRQHEVIGWHVHETDGEFIAVTDIPGNGREDEVWLGVKRNINGVDRTYIEIMAPKFTENESSEGHFLDSHIHNEPIVFPGNYGLFPFVEVTPVPEMRQNLSGIAGGTDFALQLDVAEFYWPDDSTDGLVFELNLWGDDGLGGGFAIKHTALVTGGAGTHTLLFTSPATGYVNDYLQLIAVPKDINSVSSYPVAKVSKASLILDPEGAATELAVNAEFTDQTGWGSFGATSIVNGDDIAAIQDLSHLEGKEVAIIADGVVQDLQTVVRGAIYLPYATVEDEVLVGLPFVSDVWPTLKDISTDEGTSSGRTQRITNLDIDFYNSGPCTAGRWSKEGGEKEESLPLGGDRNDPTVQIPLFTGVYHYEFPEGFDRDATYFLRQDKPYPMTIRSVVDTIEVTK